MEELLAASDLTNYVKQMQTHIIVETQLYLNTQTNNWKERNHTLFKVVGPCLTVGFINYVFTYTAYMYMYNRIYRPNYAYYKQCLGVFTRKFDFIEDQEGHPLQCFFSTPKDRARKKLQMQNSAGDVVIQVAPFSNNYRNRQDTIQDVEPTQNVFYIL